MKIININNISEISKLYSTCTKGTIFGKGPTFKIIKDKPLDQFFVCVNETINFIDNCDLLVCNDLEAFDRINLDNLQHVKNILVPYHIHVKSVANQNITYNNVIKKINNYFSGNLIVYNLTSANIIYPEYINLYSAMTSSHTGFEFIGMYLKQITQVDFYGVMVSSNYHPVFKQTTNIAIHDIQRDLAKACIKELSKKHNLAYNLN